MLETVESTNRFAADLLLAKTRPPAGTAIMARDQRSGRGQYGTNWVQEPGSGLALSVILYPEFLPARHAFRLNAAIATAVWDAIHALTGENPVQSGIRLKWPNDLIWLPPKADQNRATVPLTEGPAAASVAAKTPAKEPSEPGIAWRKLGGILLENGLSGQRLGHSIVGIGINVNQRSFPAALPNPGSLWQRDSQERDSVVLAARLCEAIESRYEQVAAGQWPACKRAYLQALDGYGETRWYAEPGGVPFQAVVAGVEDNGELALETGGTLRRYAFKAVARIREPNA
jgi:BirA family biotin operon repressor/biotin-[acetyl-CoA-carboxylase] ligase